MPDPTRRTTRIVRRALLIAAACALGLGATVAVTGGFSWTVGGTVLRAHQPWRPVGLALALWAIAACLGGVRAFKDNLARSWDARDRYAGVLAALAAVAALLIGLTKGTWTAGGADSYGYVSQALLWLKGVPVQAQPLALRVPWPLADWCFSPLGYRPGVAAGTIVPTYPPGLPLTMAGAAAIGGPGAVYWVVPVCGAAAVWATFLLGRRCAGAAGGALAAVLLAASPAFLYQIVQPMSDVPVTAWWLLSLLLIASGRHAPAGACAAAAILTRPNLAPLAAWLAAGVVLHESRRGRRPGPILAGAAAFAVPVAAGLAFLFWLNTRLYGSPFASGYGSASALFALANVPVNAGRYFGWLIETHTPLVLLGLLAPFTARFARRDPQDPAPDGAAVWFVLAFAALVVANYLPYTVFEEWWYLRFLLPALPVLLILASLVFVRLLVMVPKAGRLPVLLGSLALLAAHFVAVAGARSAFDLARLEHRYLAAGAFAAKSLPANAILLSVQESGPLRMYGGRMTLRFDYLEPRELDASVRFLESQGYRPYFALEAWEEAQFRDRFARASPMGLLDWPPVAEVGNPVKVRFYDPGDRRRFLAGELNATVRHPSDLRDRR